MQIISKRGPIQIRASNNLGRYAAMLTSVCKSLHRIPFPPGFVVDFLESGETGKHMCK